jgi:hypothetical protein
VIEEKLPQACGVHHSFELWPKLVGFPQTNIIIHPKEKKKKKKHQIVRSKGRLPLGLLYVLENLNLKNEKKTHVYIL